MKEKGGREGGREGEWMDGQKREGPRGNRENVDRLRICGLMLYIHTRLMRICIAAYLLQCAAVCCSVLQCVAACCSSVTDDRCSTCILY